MAPEKDKPGKGREGKAARHEDEAAYSTRELGRPRQRKLQPKRLDDFADRTAAAAHGEEESLDSRAALPPEDRAG